MTERIKPKKGWSRYYKPIMPSAPDKPIEELTVEEHKILFSKEMSRYSKYSLSDFNIPEGVDWKNISVEIEPLGSYDDDDDRVELKFYLTTTVSQPNPNYQRALKLYEKNLKEYQEKKAVYKEEIKQWKLWVKQEEEDTLQRNLKHAEEFLKKHGKEVK